MKKYYLSGISSDECNKGISEIASIVDKYATILNFKRFSDISLSLIIEIEEYKLLDLLNALQTIVFIADPQINPSESTSECLVFLNITFASGTGDVEIEVPNIPE
jgi:hypothetical protein